MNAKRWKTKGGVVVIERGGREVRDKRGRLRVKIEAYRETGGFHGSIWLHNCTPVENDPVSAPTPRAIRWALDVLHNDVTPRHIPYSDLLALRRFLEAQLPEDA